MKMSLLKYYILNQKDKILFDEENLKITQEGYLFHSSLCRMVSSDFYDLEGRNSEYYSFLSEIKMKSISFNCYSVAEKMIKNSRHPFSIEKVSGSIHLNLYPSYNVLLFIDNNKFLEKFKLVIFSSVRGYKEKLKEIKKHGLLHAVYNNQLIIGYKFDFDKRKYRFNFNGNTQVLEINIQDIRKAD